MESPAASTPVAVKVLAVLGALVVVVGGAFILAANIGTGGKVAIAAAVIWWIVAGAVIGKLVSSKRPELRNPIRISLAVAAVAAGVTAFIVTRPTTVDEQVITADSTADEAKPADREAALAGSRSGGEQAPKPSGGGEEAPKPTGNVALLSGTVGGESGHRGTGDATVIKRPSGARVLTLTSFDVDPGAGGLRVYLHDGKTTSDELGDFIDLAALKGTKGDQQYELPADLDLKRYSTVVIWCVPFTTRIAQAPLS